VIAWAKESLDLAKADVYLNDTLPHATYDQVQQDDSAPVPAPPPGYAQKQQEVADTRIAQAGYRLAAMLTELSVDLTPTTQPDASK